MSLPDNINIITQEAQLDPPSSPVPSPIFQQSPPLFSVHTQDQEENKQKNGISNDESKNMDVTFVADKSGQMKNLSQQDSMEEKSSSIKYKCRICDKIFSSARESLDHDHWVEVCKYCKKRGHSLNNCPTLSNRKCQKCHKLGHSELYCRDREKNSFNSNMIFGEQNSRHGRHFNNPQIISPWNWSAYTSRPTFMYYPYF